ncbi:MAG: right-handed parallel beta-helix repeat-containing protein [Myxococcota bacterium]
MRLCASLVFVLSGCASLTGEACECVIEGHGALVDGTCMCLASGPVEADPVFTHEFFLDPDLGGGDGSAASPWADLDWLALDAALADGPTVVWVSSQMADGSGAQRLAEPLFILRSDPGPHRLVLDGRSRRNSSDTAPTWVDAGTQRAIVPGIRTPFDGGPYNHVTVRGFEVTGSENKGVFWRSGDDIILEDLVVHDNRGTPAVYMDYSNRTGHASTRFVVRNSHVYNQPGECIYVGGSEGEDQVSHQRVEILNNLVHDCRNPYDTKHDGINVKDRIVDVVVEQNVVFHTDWGIEVASPGRYAHNLVFETDREAFQVSDAFSPISNMIFEDNVAVRPGHDGLHMRVDRRRADAMVIRRMTVVGASQAGLLVAGDAGAELLVEDVVTTNGGVGLDGWGEGGGEVNGCAVANNETDTRRAFEGTRCEPIESIRVTNMAGADGQFLTADDPYYLPDRGAQPPPAEVAD